MKNVMIALTALLLGIGGFGFAVKQQARAAGSGNGMVQGQVWMCMGQEEWSADCEHMDVHHKFTVIVQKWDKGHFAPSLEKFSTMPDGSFSHELAPGGYRFITMVDGWKGLMKENEDLWGMWTAPDLGKAKDRTAPAGTVWVSEDETSMVNPFHEVEMLVR